MIYIPLPLTYFTHLRLLFISFKKPWILKKRWETKMKAHCSGKWQKQNHRKQLMCKHHSVHSNHTFVFKKSLLNLTHYQYMLYNFLKTENEFRMTELAATLHYILDLIYKPWKNVLWKWYSKTPMWWMKS